MPRQRVLMACSNYWDSPFQVGSHHLARGLVRAGYEVAFLSDPISPLHLCRGWTAEFRSRLAIYRAGGKFDLEGRLWTYVPGAFLTPHNKPILKSESVQRNWHRWTWPNLASLIKKRGFDRVELLYIDSIQQSFWLNLIRYERSVYRVADYNPHFEKYTRAARTMEEQMARRVDLVVYPSRQLRAYVEELGAARSLLLENGVDYAHFVGKPMRPPPEYRHLRGPIAVYFGVIPEWFHFAWIERAAALLPEMHFVLIGPDRLARQHLGGLSNVHVLGVRPYAALPAYLHHASVGMMPFNVEQNSRGVEVLQPQKLYAYLASGLPVVSADWKNIRRLDCPAQLCATMPEFVEALKLATSKPVDREKNRRYAAPFDWNNRVTFLLEQLALVRRQRLAS
jgi:glycosyltransferase involved in cell wall biosynthesis